MRLTRIKLSGFKTFVDPTTLHIPSNLVGIVGPNGCGKSNIIDAVTWVMGESSAKHLRGNSLSDVIFNGSSSRQAVGQTSVELEFDNSEGKLGGQYASYNEISIKRQMTREGISTYYLNGSRCRRRDIQAIFLGTGLGPRSYAIIEQGVISRLIDAKPEELRTFIEEAAGISKYRERRRETENRIRHTKDNIDRLNDIREELGKQLSTLRRQARAAERYQTLKQEERKTRSELLAINWNDLNEQANIRKERVTRAETRVEQGISDLRKVEARIESHRNGLAEANEVLNGSQSNYYQIGSEIANVEQKIQHAKERQVALQEDLKKVEDSVASITLQQKNDKERLITLTREGESLSPKLDGSRSSSNEAYDSLNEAEKAMQGWQTEWDSCNEAISNLNQQIEVDSTRLEHLETNLADSRDRKLLLEQELGETDTDEMQSQLTDLDLKVEEAGKTINEKRRELELKQAEIRKLRNTSQEINEELLKNRSLQHSIAGQTAALEALQNHIAGADQDTIIDWLDSLNLGKARRLIQDLEVDPDWAQALETVLDYRLQDVITDNLDNIFGNLSGLGNGRISFVSSDALEHGKAIKPRFDSLASRVSSEIPMEFYLSGIYTADNVKKALQIQKQLKEGESVITKDGIWLGEGWIRINKTGDREGGYLSREHQINELKGREKTVAGEISSLEKRHEDNKSALDNTENEYEKLQDSLHRLREQLAEDQSRQAEIKTRLEQVRKRQQQLHSELEDIDVQVDMDKQEIEAIRHRLERNESDRDKLALQKDKLNSLREQHRHALDNARSQWQVTHEQSHEIALQLESISSQRASLEQAIQRIELQLTNQNARIEELNQEMESVKQPLAELEKILAEKLNDKVTAEKELVSARNHVQEIDAELRKAEQDRTESEQTVQNLRSELESARMDSQEIRVRLETVLEQIQESGNSVEEILSELDESADRETWQERLSDIERKINRLGPINLAAIDEFNQLTERKDYLDKQNEDLCAALDTLENAIRKIDRETRTRFKETFDELNDNLKSMFPVLFGGGHAYLLMTGTDLLETGITIMAQPPGKRNSTIQLLSGGEKAMTAVALVFAIFKLNPAPFCVLDEVDAPLDDTNVGRFSELLLQMSEEVQFIFITHNKITMEIAQQLMGVTMHEAGVSRLVSVDVDEAVQLAETA